MDVLDPSTCVCPHGSGVSYPNSFDYIPLASSFRGCRKLCPYSNNTPGATPALECGSLTLAGYSRCTLSGATVVAANSTGSGPSCDCSVPSTNPYTGQINGTWLLDATSGVCKPKCMHCVELGDGTCDTTQCPQNADGACRYTGESCDVPVCTGGLRNTVFNGTDCVCEPSWLYPDAHGTDCGVDVCTLYNGTAPIASVSDMGACKCDEPLVTDTNPNSPYFRLCVLPCGEFGAYMPSLGVCICDDGTQGPSCAATPCDADYSDGYYTLRVSTDIFFNSSSSILDREYTFVNQRVCSCPYIQRQGLFCDVDTCVHGTPRAPPEQGCDCSPVAHGVLCELEYCDPAHSVLGMGAESKSDFACYCKPGWFGPHCSRNMCGDDLPGHPVPCGGSDDEPDCVFSTLDYNCACDPGVFDASGRCIYLPTCGKNGTLYAKDDMSGYECVCAFPYSGVQCADLPCGVTTLDELDEERMRWWPIEDGTACECVSPYSGPRCEVVNCSEYNTWQYSNPTVQVIQQGDTSCGCSVSDHSLKYVGVEVGGNSSVYGWACTPNCMRMWTYAGTVTECICIEGVMGHLCDTLSTSLMVTPYTSTLPRLMSSVYDSFYDDGPISIVISFGDANFTWPKHPYSDRYIYLNWVYMNGGVDVVAQREKRMSTLQLVGWIVFAVTMGAFLVAFVYFGTDDVSLKVDLDDPDSDHDGEY